ncbi:MAG: hypothetical protein K9J33_06055 [Bacteroidales bacterium]|nr:hypothetical protein [Bacteroidales bacterium]
MRISIVVFLMLILSINSLAQDIMVDAVYLKSGAVYKGIITEQMEGQKLWLQTLDGRTLEIDYSVISRIEREPAVGIDYSSGNRYSKKEKDPGLAFLYSFLLPGGGQFYNGQNLKGALMLTGYLGGAVTAIALASSGYVPPEEIYIPMGGVFIIWLYSVIDAPVNANKINDKALTFNLLKSKNYSLEVAPQVITCNNPINNHVNNSFSPGFSLYLNLK